MPGRAPDAPFAPWPCYANLPSCTKAAIFKPLVKSGELQAALTDKVALQQRAELAYPPALARLLQVGEAAGWYYDHDDAGGCDFEMLPRFDRTDDADFLTAWTSN